jgi:hypothetical protein
MCRNFAIFAILLMLAVSVGPAAADPSGTQPPTKEQAIDAGFDCTPDVIIFGHFHCAQPGRPSLQDVIDGARPTTFQLKCFSATGAGLTDPSQSFFLGTEQLIRADLFQGQPCPDAVTGQWTPLAIGSPDVNYYACHHFQL